jgi:heme exporter protein B
MSIVTWGNPFGMNSPEAGQPLAERFRACPWHSNILFFQLPLNSFFPPLSYHHFLIFAFSKHMLQEIKHLVRKEFLLESRQKQSINGIVLYLISTVFVCKMCFRTLPDPASWNALFWIILLFASVNAAGKSFIQDSGRRFIYMYTLASPQAIVISKIIYNMVLMLLLSGIGFILYVVLLGGNPVQNMTLFILDVLLGSMGFSAILTTMSAISSRTNNSFTLMAILSFPILLPLLLTIIKISKNAIDGIDPSISYKYLLVLAGINVITVVLSYLLFPYLWKD